MKIIMISHGQFAEGLHQSIDMICGDTTAVEHLCLRDGVGVDTFEKEFIELITKYKNQELIILTDIIGGSPFNTALKVLSEKQLFDKSILINGMNLPLLLNLVLLEHMPTNDELQKAIESSRENLANFSFTPIASNEDEEL